MKFAARVMDNTLAYRLWMAPFAEMKFAPIVRNNDMSRVRRVLDVGCGPGTNAPHFAGVDYLGLDFNPAYIEDAKRRHGRDFIVADVTTYEPPSGERYDFVLVNSLLHHLDDAGARHILSHLGRLLTPDGFVHVIELVLPERASVPRFLARSDRGDFPRSIPAWRSLLGESLDIVHEEPFPVTGLGMTLWEMVYFKLKARA